MAFDGAAVVACAEGTEVVVCNNDGAELVACDDGAVVGAAVVAADDGALVVGATDVALYAEDGAGVSPVPGSTVGGVVSNNASALFAFT